MDRKTITNGIGMNVGIIGVGKLGLVYALSFEKHGLNVWASSYKKEYVEDLQNKKTNTTEPMVAQQLAISKNIKFTVDNHEVLNHCDIIYVMVATPSLPEGNYDISAVYEVINDVVNHPGNVDNKIVIIGSTVNPGDCMQLQNLLSARGVQLVYAPTFAAQGTVFRDIEHPYALMLGTTHASTAERCRQLFFNIIPSDTPVHVMHPTSGEIMKISANCYATMKISYFNIIGQLMIASGLDQDIKAANEFLSEADHRQSHLQFGFGYGGPCYPRDNKSLQHYNKKIGMNFPYAQITDEFNQGHIQFLTNYFLQQNKFGLPFYFRYISYKPGVNIFEESHQLEVCKRLLAHGCKVFVEPTEFLGDEIQKELSNQWGNQIEFVSLKTLQAKNQSMYMIDL